MGKKLNDKQRLLDQIRADILSQNICPDLVASANNCTER
jgi:hypothetical protein